jgi:hypothetical protein
MKTTKVKKILILLVTSLIFIQSAFSQVSTSFGAPDCGQWATKAKSNPSYKSWVVGYLSGLNSALFTSKNDPLDKINSAEQIFLWMDNFCQRNPLKNVQDGGNALYLELGGNKK